MTELISAKRPLIILESPYAAKDSTQFGKHLLYLRQALRHAWDKGENPFAPHAFYPFFLRESDPEERKAGIAAGYEMWPHASRIVFYTDLGWSPGMLEARRLAGNYFGANFIDERIIGASLT